MLMLNLLKSYSAPVHQGLDLATLRLLHAIYCADCRLGDMQHQGTQRRALQHQLALHRLAQQQQQQQQQQTAMDKNKESRSNCLTFVCALSFNSFGKHF